MFKRFGCFKGARLLVAYPFSLFNLSIGATLFNIYFVSAKIFSPFSMASSMVPTSRNACSGR